MIVERMNELSARTAALLYAAIMTAWVVGFAGTNRELPGLLVLVLLLLPAAVHFGLGYVVADWWALYLAAVPVVVAAPAGGGLPSPLWVSVVLLTAFPGAPLIALGIYVRERRDPSYVDPWLS